MPCGREFKCLGYAISEVVHSSTTPGAQCPVSKLLFAGRRDFERCASVSARDGSLNRADVGTEVLAITAGILVWTRW